MKKKDADGELAFYGFASDQSPKPKPKSYWREFLGVKVPVFMGAELIARELNFAIVYTRVNRIKRGYYEAEFELLTDNPKKTKKYENRNSFWTVYYCCLSYLFHIWRFFIQLNFGLIFNY